MSRALEGTFTGARGLALFRRTWRPTGPSRAGLINLHGLGDHSGLYPMVGAHMTARGIVVHAPDLRGNGRSPGQRGYVRLWADYREDLRALVTRIREEEGELPLFLLGNSLGGLIAL